MTTLNITQTINSGTYNKRSTGMTGQVLSSPQIEAKLARVETLYEQYHGVKLGRYNLYNTILPLARETKADSGGYIHGDAGAIVLKALDVIHKALGKAVKRKNKQKPVTVDIGVFTIDNLRDLARGKRGRKSSNAA
tara:strand:+ start:321 stop:728 length:408 start_codon:yes stop_codon:yes gene_type:complete